MVDKLINDEVSKLEVANNFKMISNQIDYSQFKAKKKLDIKKYLIPFSLVFASLIFIFLIGKMIVDLNGSSIEAPEASEPFPPKEDSPSEVKPNEPEIGASSIVVNGYEFIDSNSFGFEEFNLLINEKNQIDDLGISLEQLKKYDDSYFIDNSLLLIAFTDASISYSHELDSVTIDENINVIIRRNKMPEGSNGMAAEACIYLIIEIDKIITSVDVIFYLEK